jgi:hypothetical protein
VKETAKMVYGMSLLPQNFRCCLLEWLYDLEDKNARNYYLTHLILFAYHYYCQLPIANIYVAAAL